MTNQEHQGLTSKEAKILLKKYGENIFIKKKKISPIIAFIKKFNSPFLLVLIFAAIISFFVGEHANAVIILTIVLVSAVIDFTNSFQSEKAVEGLIKKVASTASVVRSGKVKDIPLKNVVPGDLVMLSAGDIIPADCKVIEAENFFLNQSTLTGESFPVEAESGKTIFLGTSVVAGSAKAVVEKTGLSTEYGKIAKRLEAPPPETGFERNLRGFSVFMLRITFVMVCVVFLANVLLKRNTLESLLFAVAIAVGLTPELLPIIMSVSLSRGSIQMGKKEVIVKNLSSIESFGSMDILCTDKTGTLTQNKITLIKYVDISGNTSEKVLLYTYLSGTFHSGVKDIFDNAIREFRKIDVSSYNKIDELPFDFQRKRESMVVDSQGKREIITKGAP